MSPTAGRSASAVLPAVLLLAVLFSASAYAGPSNHSDNPAVWAQDEIGVLKSLSLSSLPPLPKDPSNRYTDDPKAAAFGKKLFFDVRFSANGKVSCASCHQPGYGFTDNLPLAHGMGTTTRRTMPLIGAAYQSWFFWDGRKDSLWSQAIGPIESAVEHGVSRGLCAHLVSDNYRKEYAAVFGALPHIDHKNCPTNASPLAASEEGRRAWEGMRPSDRDAVNRIYANIGKAIAAYVRRILPSLSRFDRYVDALAAGDYAAAQRILSAEEVAGLKLFIGKAGCTNCHNGPLLSNSGFHAVGLRSSDRGRAEGIQKVMGDEFNCLGKYSDAKPRQCAELRFIDSDTTKYEGAMKTPSLRGVADRPPYMHAGQMSTLRDVLVFYQKESTSREIGHAGLSDSDIANLEAFLRTLSSPIVSP